MKFTREALRSFIDDEIKGMVCRDGNGGNRLRPFKKNEEKFVKTLAFSALDTVNNAEAFKREEVVGNVLDCIETMLEEMYADSTVNTYRTLRLPLVKLCNRLIEQSIWGA